MRILRFTPSVVLTLSFTVVTVPCALAGSASAATGCRRVGPRLPIIVEIDLPVSPQETISDLAVELSSADATLHRSPDLVVTEGVVNSDRLLATVTWGGSSSSRRIRPGTYEVVVMSSVGRATTCVTVARSSTAKRVGNVQSPIREEIEVISIGRGSEQGGWR